MTTKTIHHGQTLTLSQPQSFAGTLVIQGGVNGGAGGTGIITPQGMLTNHGSIMVQAGAAAAKPGQGGHLLNNGVLINADRIDAAGGTGSSAYAQGGGGALIANAGSLDNQFAASIDIHGGGIGLYAAEDPGAILHNTGVLTNGGQLLVGGGVGAGPAYGYYNQGAAGGLLDTSGTLTNTSTGLIDIAGGAQGTPALYGGGGGYGGTLSQSGVLTNSGAIVLDGGAGGTTSDRAGGLGAALYATGTLTNTGSIAVYGGQGGFGAFAQGGFGGMLDISGVITNSGQITASQGGSASGQYATNGSGGSIYIDGVLTSTGTITVQGTPGSALSGYLAIDAGGQLSLSGAALLQGGGRVENSGLLIGNGTVSGLTIANEGVIEASQGLLTLNADITQSGRLSVAAGATLSLAGTVSSSQTVSLAATGVLELTAATAAVAIAAASGATVDVLGGGAAMLNASDTHLTVDLATAGSLTLSQLGFVTAQGSAGADTLVALAAQQTLTGGAGLDTLIGSAADGDTFRDTAAGLNGDTIGNFAGSDVIDITDLAPGTGLTLSYAPGDDSGTLKLREGGHSTTITLLGNFSQNQFTTSSDGLGGVLIGLHPGG